MPSDCRPQHPTYAVLIGLDSLQGLQAARILARHNVPVIALAADPGHYGCRTNVCEKVIYADTESNALIGTLETLGPKLGHKAVLFPCEDANVLLVSRNRRHLEKWYHIVLPATEIVELMMDKVSFYEFAKEKGFPIPATHILRCWVDAEEVADKLSFPCILKPPNSATPEWERNCPSSAFKVHTQEELLSLYDCYRRWTDALIVQELIEGPDTNHYSCNCYFDATSEPVVTFTTRKLRQWPPNTGIGCLGEECRNDVVSSETVRLFRSVHYWGLCYLEMKQDARSGKYFIIEPNIGRPTGRSATAELGGVELLYTMYCDAVGWPLPLNREQTFKGTKWVYLRQDLQSALYRWRRGELTLKEWWRSWRGLKTDAVFSWRDPLPFLSDVARVGGALLFDKERRNTYFAASSRKNQNR